eukprot:TRINITY_DN1167_c0_g1_i1.p1 TRINITY_DN1167_c0_g1~~TRINITY_DN1167_c0_g1_i1.p1  ORF type:complete len:215 (+),score=48.06 TRINITY_DN1167_c0_g1_i1:246-890(+)
MEPVNYAALTSRIDALPLDELKDLVAELSNVDQHFAVGADVDNPLKMKTANNNTNNSSSSHQNNAKASRRSVWSRVASLQRVLMDIIREIAEIRKLMPPASKEDYSGGAREGGGSESRGEECQVRVRWSETEPALLVHVTNAVELLQEMTMSDKDRANRVLLEARRTERMKTKPSRHGGGTKSSGATSGETKVRRVRGGEGRRSKSRYWTPNGL